MLEPRQADLLTRIVAGPTNRQRRWFVEQASADAPETSGDEDG
jgi:hypothetical protein